MISTFGNALRLLVYDSLLFFVALIICIIYIYRHHRGTTKNILYTYLIITLSITNIFVKPIQDYLIPIPRTYIYYYKVFANLSPYDLFIMGVFVYICCKYLFRGKYKRILFAKNELSDIFKCDLWLLFLSYIGFAVYMLGDNPVDSIVQIKKFRLILNAFVSVFIGQMTIWIYKAKTDEDVFQLVTTLFFINFMVYSSEFISSFLIQDICWERGGHKVSLLDQTGAGLALIYIPFVICKNSFLKKWMLLTAYFFLILLIFNLYKTWILSMGITIIFMIIFGLHRGRINLRIFNYSLMGLVAIIIFSISVAKGNTDSVRTREAQNDMLIEAFIKNPVNIACGIGHGGMIRKQTVTEDGGETRAIDLERNDSAKYVVTYQVPFFNIIKFSGIIGMILCIGLFVRMVKCSYVVIKYGWYFSFCIVFMAVNLLLGTRLFYSDPQMSIYYVEAYVIFKLLLQRQIRIMESKKKDGRIFISSCTNI